MGFAMAHYSMGFAMEHSKENCYCVFNQPGFFLHCIILLPNVSLQTQTFILVWKFKGGQKVSVVDKMSFQELLSLRATKSNNQEQEEPRREDEGE